MVTSPNSSISPTLRPEGLAKAMIVFTLVFLILNTGVVVLRVWVRAWMLRAGKVWGWDDTVICLSYISYVPCSAYSIVAAYHGVGSRDSKLNSTLSAKAASDLGYWEIGYAVSVNLAKASIALALMRMSVDRRYTIALWAFMISEMATSVICLITFWAICDPPGAQWNSSLGTCESYTIIPTLSWPFSVVNILSDRACAIIPYLMIRKLNIKRSMKYSLVAVLAMGGLASVGAIVRVPYLKYYYIEQDRLYYFGYVNMFSMLENGLGIFAACLPPLNKLLLCFGRNNSSARASGRAGASETIGGTPLSRLDTFVGTKNGSKGSSGRTGQCGEWNRLADDSSSRDLRLQPISEFK
ncbi:hypothetical protein SUNI508_04969 [Seiridium unicorne]|uniref:Rhodopsin domain-containing protein n=1 Tax=Seiridium unicorne TaxID=138068 RepID=A0ABR2V5W5_9PEZI